MWPPVMSLKRELHAKYRLILFEGALQVLKNDMYINKISQAVLEI